MIDVKCQHCDKTFRVGERYAGQRVRCVLCGEQTPVPEAGQGMPPSEPYPMEKGAYTGGQEVHQVPPPPPVGTDYSNLRTDRPTPNYYSQPTGGGEQNPIMGWVIFILIFGVGNLILYSTTGIFIIPIRR